MEIRRFQKKDLAQVLALCNEVREHHRDFLNGYFTPQNDEYEQRAYLQSLENDESYIAWVATEGDVVLGLLLAKKKVAPYLEEPNLINVDTLGVKKAYRGQGIGRKLMDTLYEYCHQNHIDELKLGVFNKNTSAYRFYEKYGFEPLEQRMSLKIK